MKEEKKPLSAAAKKKLTERARKDNIAESEKRKPAKPAPPAPELTEKEKAKKEEIQKRLKKLSKKADEKLADLPYFVLRPMKDIPFEEDHFLTDAIKDELRRLAKEDLKKKGDHKRETLKFTHVNACPREVFFDFFEPHEARAPAPKGQLFMTDGTIYHKYLQRMLEDLGLVRETEGYLTLPGIPSNGYYDGLVPVGQDGKWTVCDILEIKRKMPTACDKPQQRDYDQGQLYLSGADESERLKSCRVKIRGLRLLYSDRAMMTDECFYGFLSRRDKGRIRLCRQYMSFLWEEVVQKKKLVVHPYSIDSSKCNTFCQYTERCWRKHRASIKPRDLEAEGIELPDAELVESAAREAYKLLSEIAERQAKYKKIKPMIEAHMLHNELAFMKVEEDDKEERGLQATQSKSLFWHDRKKLIDNIGIDAYLDISDVDKAAVDDLVREHHLDNAVFEKHKRYKLKSMTLKKHTRRKA